MLKYWFLVVVLDGGPMIVPGGYMSLSLCEQVKATTFTWYARNKRAWCVGSELPRRKQ